MHGVLERTAAAAHVLHAARLCDSLRDLVADLACPPVGECGGVPRIGPFYTRLQRSLAVTSRCVLRRRLTLHFCFVHACILVPHEIAIAQREMALVVFVAVRLSVRASWPFPRCVRFACCCVCALQTKGQNLEVHGLSSIRG